MPHLTSTGVRLSATEESRLGFGVPGYAHPLLAPAEWAELTRPGTPLHWAVLNVADGPGACPDPHCLEAVGRLANAGARVLGHLDLAYGTRPLGELVADAQRHLDWYRVGGFYLDRCPAGRDGLDGVRRTAEVLTTLRPANAARWPAAFPADAPDAGPGPVPDGAADTAPEAARGAASDPAVAVRQVNAVRRAGARRPYLVLGHGTHPYPGYAETADQLVTFSGPWADYRWSQAAEWTAAHPPERFVHLVHGIPRHHLEEAMRIARWQGAGTIFFTDREDRTGQNSSFETLPGFWDEIVSRLGPGVSE
ncbi:spherulation-specific family 4 protein [Streptomyces hebeiensis]